MKKKRKKGGGEEERKKKTKTQHFSIICIQFMTTDIRPHKQSLDYL